MHRGRASSVAATSLALAILASSCAGSPTCSAVPVTRAAQGQLAAAREQIDFAIVEPCAFGARLRVERVLVDTLPGQPVQPRVTFIVESNGERAFIFSETRAMLPFSAIPQGTQRLTVQRAGVSARGFAGPSGDGGDISYLRWRIGGVTFELFAALESWQTLRDIELLAGAFIERSAVVAPD